MEVQIELQGLAESNRIANLDLSDPADKENVLEVVTVENLASTIVESSVVYENEEEEVPQFSDAKKLEILANARTVLDMVGLMTEDV